MSHSEVSVTTAAGTKKPALDLSMLFPEFELITDADLKAKVASVWEEIWSTSPWTELDKLPSSIDNPYPHLPHNRCVLAIALAIADSFERFHRIHVNRNRLIAAAILQDSSKLLEYRPIDEGKAELTDIGRQYPHAFLAAHIAANYGVSPEIINIILTHSSRAAAFPSTLEGMILSAVDQIDVLAVNGNLWCKEIVMRRSK